MTPRSLLPESTSPAPGFTRRGILRAGGLGAFGLSMQSLTAARAERAKDNTKPAKSVILLFLLGAPPQHETWDPKPDAPAEVRGDMRPIATAVPGISIGETFPKIARQLRKIALLRAVQTGDPAHSSSGYYMTTGYPHAPKGVENAKPGAPNDWPCVGAVVRKLSTRSSVLPIAMTLPEEAANDGNKTWPGQDAGFLGRASDPWTITTDPSLSTFAIPGLDLPNEVPGERFTDRNRLLSQLDRDTRDDPAHQSRVRRAVEMVSSADARRAFRLQDEDEKLRDRYGRNRFGQSCLLARRLVEAGVPFIRVNWTRVPNAPNNGHWDTHTKNTEGVKALGPILDAAYSTLLEDLADRGMLDNTLVICTGEFGRTPKLNGSGGRDHWGQVFSVALAGGGVRGGMVHGASDSIAAYPKDGLVKPEDLTATILHTLGIPPESELTDPQGRPFVASRGKPISAIFA